MALSKSSGPHGSPCCKALVLGIFSGPKHGATRRILQRKTGSVDLVEGVLQVSTVTRHRLSSLSCFRSHRLSVCSETVASRALAVSRRVSPTATGRWLLSFFFKAASESLAIQEEMNAFNVALGHHADRGMETPHKFVVLPREEAPSDVLWAEGPRRAHRTVG